MNIKWGDYVVFEDEDGNETEPLFVVEIIYNNKGITYGCKQLQENTVICSTGSTVYHHQNELNKCYDGDAIREQWDRTVGIVNLIPNCKIRKIVFNTAGIQFSCDVNIQTNVLE